MTLQNKKLLYNLIEKKGNCLGVDCSCGYEAEKRPNTVCPIWKYLKCNGIMIECSDENKVLEASSTLLITKGNKIDREKVFKLVT